MFIGAAPIDGAAGQPRQRLDHRLQFDSPEEVDAWHRSGRRGNGGTAIEDPPGWREHAFGKLYLAYLRDPDGNKLCGPPPPAAGLSRR